MRDARFAYDYETRYDDWLSFFATSMWRDLKMIFEVESVGCLKTLAASGINDRKADEMRGAFAVFQHFIETEDWLLSDLRPDSQEPQPKMEDEEDAAVITG